MALCRRPVRVTSFLVRVFTSVEVHDTASLSGAGPSSPYAADAMYSADSSSNGVVSPTSHKASPTTSVQPKQALLEVELCLPPCAILSRNAFRTSFPASVPCLCGNRLALHNPILRGLRVFLPNSLKDVGRCFSDNKVLKAIVAFFV